MAVTDTETSIFDFTGNNLCLDFTNTLQDRTDKPRELLISYGDLVLWSQEAHIITENEARRLNEKAAQHRAEAAAVLKQAIDLREAMYRIFDAIANGSPAEESDLAMLNAALSQSMAQACIIQREDGFVWDWVDKDLALDRMLWVLLRSAADLLTSEERHSVRECASDDCNWLFLDTSKNHSRRWCDMKSCGNRAKVRKHYHQKKHTA